MSYEKTTWSKGDTITAQKLNNMESGIENAFGAYDQQKKIIDRSITHITIPESVETIGKCAFAGCEALESVVIHSNVSGIGAGAFSGCSKLSVVNIPEGITEIEDATFADCTSLKNISIPDTVTMIKDVAFSSAGLVGVEFSASVGYGAFQNCKSLKTLKISGVATNVDNSAFSGCSALESIDLAESIDTLRSAAFGGCDEVTEMIVRATTPPTVQSNAINSIPANCPIYVPAGSVDTYKSANGWSARASYIQAIQE